MAVGMRNVNHRVNYKIMTRFGLFLHTPEPALSALLLRRWYFILLWPIYPFYGSFSEWTLPGKNVLEKEEPISQDFRQEAQKKVSM